MENPKTLNEWMEERGIAGPALRAASGLDRRVFDAILHGRYTPSPEQRQRLASALGVEPAQIAWGHTTQVSHLYGHGPQFGRTP